MRVANVSNSSKTISKGTELGQTCEMVESVLDYRKLNRITKKDSYLLPQIDTLDVFAGSSWFQLLL